jgi:proteasome assembly chaperone (PAC2) family protein
MSWWRRTFGMDGIDILIQAGVTVMLMAFVGTSGGPNELYPVMIGASLLVLGVRRALGLRAAERRGLTTGKIAAERIAELEQRMGDLEAAQARVAELEERVDFTERLLAQGSSERHALRRGDAG